MRSKKEIKEKEGMVWVSCCDSTWEINWIDQWNVCWNVHEQAREKDLLIASNNRTATDLVLMDTHTSAARQHNRALPLKKNPPRIEPELELTSLGCLRWICTCVGPTVTQTENDPGGEPVAALPISTQLVADPLSAVGWVSRWGLDWLNLFWYFQSNWSLGSWEAGALSPLLA